MKVTNHQKGNYTFVSPSDSSVMYGTIEMTLAEYNDAIKYLKKCYSNAKRDRNTYMRDSLYSLFDFAPRTLTPDGRVCLGVCATELLFKHYQLPRYKRQNYVIQITNK